MARLIDAGLSGAEGEAKTALFTRALLALGALGARASEARAWWVPGRIEILGKHTDYAGGRSLLCACERGFAVAAVPRADTRVHVRDARADETAEGALQADLAIRRDHWANYPLTVARRVARNFAGPPPPPLHGVDIAFASDLPRDAGLSSSSALVVATFLALSDANELSRRAEYRSAIRGAEDLAGYLGAVENGQSYRGLAGDRGVGTMGGSEDHTAILCGRPGALVQYSFVPVRFERAVPFPPAHVLVVASSGVRAAKTGSALNEYNRASGRAAAALRAWQQASGSAIPTLAGMLGESPDAMQRLRAEMRGHAEAPFDAESLLDRVEQFRAESMEIIPSAGDALARGDLGRFGALVDESQANAERWLGNQVPETIAMAREARALGAVAASAFGAGFGGSVYALVRADEATDLTHRWAAWYKEAFPARAEEAEFFTTRAGPPATAL